ncbi:hypothetical protein DPMN_121569 [Dreissena polymorpha]|uniref:Uncharacterized protein n=1 Tax=Dreissena polymorpha TaxID=45954 RepID=A0A9D4GLU9_DREPO|nr:hypothetical protein DPMN_121569 [Dreissena polymorpha]
MTRAFWNSVIYRAYGCSLCAGMRSYLGFTPQMLRAYFFDVRSAEKFPEVEMLSRHMKAYLYGIDLGLIPDVLLKFRLPLSAGS